MQAPRRRWLAPLLALSLGALSLWEVTEQDIYWQVRAGDELLRTWTFPEVDTWSFAAAGEPWMNLQWLSTLLFRAAYVLGPPGLVLARGLVVALLFLVLARLVRSAAGRAASWTAEATLLPLVWLAIAFRLQLRADTLVFIVYAFVLWWRAARPSHPRSTLVYLGAVVLAANLHPGTSPFVMVAAGYVLVTTDASWRWRLLRICALVPADLLTPYHLHVLPFLRRHFFYFEEQVLTNPDHQRLDLARHLDIDTFGLAGLVWLGLSLLGAAGLALDLRREPRRTVLPLLVAALLTTLCLDRTRAFPYQTIFLLPFATRALVAVYTRLRPFTLLLPAAALPVLAYHLTISKHVLGLRDSRAMYPIDSVAFIRAWTIQPNLYHTFAFGAYIVWYLRDYPDFVDPRETPFRKLERDYLGAYASPEHARMLYEKYGVNAVLVPIPGTVLVPGLGHRDIIEEWLPASDWALVYWDDLAVLVVRRIPAHARVIAEHEYKHLRPNLPADDFLARGRVRTSDEIRQFTAEVRRCREERPHDALCQASERVAVELIKAMREASPPPR